MSLGKLSNLVQFVGTMTELFFFLLFNSIFASGQKAIEFIGAEISLIYQIP